MARISTYAIDAKPSLGDKVIGTEGSGNFLTKNYSFEDIVELLNITNSTAVADQMIYEFQWDLSQGRSPGTISFASGGGINTAFSTITSVLISKTLPGGQAVSSYANLFNGKDIILSEIGNRNSYGTYKVTNITTYLPDVNFFEVSLEASVSNGAILQDKYYIFSEFVNGDLEEDKHFTYNQGIPSSVWNIQHNLNKFPSVSIVDTSGSIIYTDVEYIDINNLRLTFFSALSGKAYMN
jgi:hypothetical protein|tara:strand:+ start:284 stop:997 length:714 start_codon:yes stop_codon:yes gene_type:complete